MQEIKYRRVGIVASFSSRRSCVVRGSTDVASSEVARAGANEGLVNGLSKLQQQRLELWVPLRAAMPVLYSLIPLQLSGLMYVPPRLTVPRVWISEQPAVISPYSFN